MDDSSNHEGGRNEGGKGWNRIGMKAGGIKNSS